MKKTVMLFAVAVYALFAAGAEMKNALMIQKEGALWTKTENGEMKWAKNIAAGTAIQLDDSAALKAQRQSGGKLVDSEFYPALYEGKDYFVMTDRVAVAGEKQVKVMVQNAVLYGSASVLDYSSTIVPFKKLVVVGETRQMAGMDFVSVLWFDDVNYVKRNGWVRAEKVGLAVDDLAALQLVDKAKAAKDDKVKNAVIADAYTLEISDEVRHLISVEEYNILQGFNPDNVSTGKVQLRIDSPMEESGYYVHIYDIPSTKGRVVGRVFYADKVRSDKETADSTTERVQYATGIEEVKYSWFHILANIAEDGTVIWPSGWVYGVCNPR